MTIQNTKLSEPLLEPVKKKEFTNDELMQALYWLWDGFDRALINFFLIYKTANAVIQRQLLHGDAIFVGVRDVDYKSGSWPIFKDFAGEPIEKSDNHETYLYNNVPVYIFIFPDDACTRNLNPVLYQMENFNLPNPYEEFQEKYGIFCN